MAILNRSMDASEQLEVLSFRLAAATTTGGTYALGLASTPCEVRAIRVSAQGISGTPTARVQNHRFVAGAGQTTIGLSLMAQALTVSAVGTSGPLSATLAAAGSSNVQLSASDQLVVQIAGSNSGADNLLVEVVVKKLADYASRFGLSS